MRGLLGLRGCVRDVSMSALGFSISDLWRGGMSREVAAAFALRERLLSGGTPAALGDKAVGASRPAATSGESQSLTSGAIAEPTEPGHARRV